MKELRQSKRVTLGKIKLKSKLMLQQLKMRHRMGGIFSATLDIGGHNTLLPAQYAIQDRILVQVHSALYILIETPMTVEIVLDSQAADGAAFLRQMNARTDIVPQQVFSERQPRRQSHPVDISGVQKPS